MCWKTKFCIVNDFRGVSVAGCLGYDVLETNFNAKRSVSTVSVAGCLGYDVLGVTTESTAMYPLFQLLVV